ncbi:serine racemase-like isoform X2 [Lytechinus pictus]|uniref:serine racemase-like isoform X2 n=1 Tax=Lytechinus pictus TaxID=7653 RepID=UPI0030BA1C30
MLFDKILGASKRVANYISPTPVFTSGTVDKLTGRNVFFKAENLQKTGSFKIRGALNAILLLKENQAQTNGVVTHSTGNHGSGLACAAQMVGVPCTVVVPHTTASVKVDAIRWYGADVVFCEPTQQSRKETCEHVASEKNLSFVPAYDDYNVMAGQGTIGIEICEQVQDLDAVLVMTSGGGLIAGIATAVKGMKPNVKVFAVEPEGKDLQRSLESGERMWVGPPKTLDTVADATPTQQVGQLTWPIVRDLVEKQVFTVTDDEIISAMKFTWTRLKLVVEAASAGPVAAVLSDKMKAVDPRVRNVAVLMCGGNVNIEQLPW